MISVYGNALYHLKPDSDSYIADETIVGTANLVCGLARGVIATFGGGASQRRELTRAAAQCLKGVYQLRYLATLMAGKMILDAVYG